MNCKQVEQLQAERDRAEKEAEYERKHRQLAEDAAIAMGHEVARLKAEVEAQADLRRQYSKAIDKAGDKCDRLRAELDALKGKAKAEHPEVEVTGYEMGNAYFLRKAGGEGGFNLSQAEAVKRAYDAMVRLVNGGAKHEWIGNISARRILSGR